MMMSLIQYYEQVQAEQRILDTIVTALDQFWNEAWIEEDQAFVYRAGRTKGSADLNLLIAPAYAWAFLKTGDRRHLERGDQAFEGGVNNAFLKGAKQFNQNYLWSFDFVRWREVPPPEE